MTVSSKGPEWWANRASILLRQSLGETRFPIDPKELALEWSKALEPEAPITRVASREIEGFEGALIDARARGNGWGIAYAKGIRSEGRRRFTIAHEFGHFLLHRKVSPAGGFQCRQEDMAAWDHDWSPQEVEANRFAAGLLMPLDDFRAQIPARATTTMVDLSAVANRYGVSLTASTLRWLDYTECRAVLVASRDGFILWAKSSRPALRSGRFFRTRNGPPIELPVVSPLASGDTLLMVSGATEHAAGTWFDSEPVTEEVIASDRYDLGLSLLTLRGGSTGVAHQEEAVRDTVDLMVDRE